MKLLNVHTIGSDAVRTINLNSTVTDVFHAGTGQVLLSSINSIVLYDLQQQGPITELQGAPVKYAYWNADLSMVALISKHSKFFIDL
jgi:coatomer protein complex subunit alpha (xenin)